MKTQRIRLAAAMICLTLSGIAQAGVYDDLIIAARNDDGDKVTQLLQRGMDVNTVDMHGTTLAMYAARAGNEKLLEYLLNNKANILIKNEYGDTAISFAALEGHLTCVRQLAQAGAQINPEGGWSPLNYAAFAGRDAVASYLIEQGAKVDTLAPNGMTSLMLASRNGHPTVVMLLVNRDANRSLKSPDGKTAADIAKENGYTQIATMLAAPGSPN